MIDILHVVVILYFLYQFLVLYPLVFREFLQVHGRYSLESSADDCISFLLDVLLDFSK